MLADRRAVRQILINLVSNACKFTAKGGRVTVSARRAGSNIEVAVTDSGIGIAAEHIARLGQPFYQVDTRYARQNEGAGLGLSIVRGLVELHGGALGIESEAGKGSRFAVTMAADVDAIEAETAVRPPKPGVVVELAELHRRQVERAAAEATNLTTVRAG